ncbi:MAG: DUF3108 domain-containing protein, partial [Gammaproteobacteria bacterium]
MSIRSRLTYSSPPRRRGSRHLNFWIPLKPALAKAGAGITILLLVTFSAAADATPVIPLYHATYSVDRNDLRIGTANFSLTQNKDGTYTYQSVTQASGLAALFFSDVITETSHFTVSNGHLQPLLYSYTPAGNDHDKPESIRFDWNK